MSVLSKYKFTNKRHSHKALMSVGLALIGIVTVVLTITGGFKAGGEVEWKHAAAVGLAVLMALAGAILGLMARLEKDRYYFFPDLGLTLNVVVLILGIYFVVRGMQV